MPLISVINLKTLARAFLFFIFLLVTLSAFIIFTIGIPLLVIIYVLELVKTSSINSGSFSLARVTLIICILYNIVHIKNIVVNVKCLSSKKSDRGEDNAAEGDRGNGDD